MLVISDLRLPRMDGFELLNRILRKYPDVPVIIITAHDRPKTKDVVFKSGAVGYLKKPVAPDKLVREITKMLARKAEGGNLHSVSLETFLQLVEMEQQTCTLHVLDRSGAKGGVLYFRNGELYNARICERQGKEAAYEILSWSGVSVFIENNCVFDKKLIEGDLQAILLDAMRSKDENEENSPDEKAAAGETADEQESSPVETSAEERFQGKQKTSRPGLAGEQSQGAPEEASGTAENSVSAVRNKLNASLGNYRGVEDIYEDKSWDQLVTEAASLGEILGFGSLNLLYAGKLDKKQYLVVPGEESTVIVITPDAPRDKIIGAVS
jgi:hypothetical protein